ncbi:penicillin-binding protein activator [bacterium]|nr:penicillin-binding protein activator [bacterium]RQV93660.1 MAG: outer membrane protein assembly factor BamD [bacterium]
MERNVKGFCIIFLVVFFNSAFLLGQDAQPVDSLFFRSIDFYQRGNYTEALQVLDLLNDIYPDHKRTTAALLMEGKTLYKLQRYQQAEDMFHRFINQFPGSHYLDDAYYGLGSVYYRRKLYRDAVIQFLNVIDTEGDTQLQVKAAKLSREIMDYYMHEEDLRSLLSSVSGEKAKAAVIVRLANREMEQQQYQAAINNLENFLNTYPKSPYVDQVKKLLDEAIVLGEGTSKVGVILPLTGAFSEQGKALLEGIRYAIDLHNAEGEGTQVELVIRDSEGSIIRSIKMAQELCKDEEILTIIGELQSDITATIAAVAQENGVVLLAPTATANGIASIGPYIFQVNNDLHSRGKTLAEYAMTVLNLQQFAILTTPDEYGKSMRDAFVETVNRLGGEIISDTYYYEGAEDKNTYFDAQFRTIREAGIQKMIDDSLLIIVSEKEYEEILEPQHGDTLYVKQSFFELVDSTELAVTSIGGLFLPVYREDLPFVIPKIASQNIITHILGGATWHDPDLLEEQKKYVDEAYIDGVIFLSDYFINPSDYTFYRFRDAYRSKTGKTPEKMEVYGVDTANLFLSIVGEKSLPRQEIREQLAQSKPFTGMRGTISLNEERVNTSICILQYRGNDILQIK